jgi:hypothetical protein
MARTLLAGRVGQLGGGKKYEKLEPTISQLIDFQKAGDAGAMSGRKYQREEKPTLRGRRGASG